jgi:hypothetical protein
MAKKNFRTLVLGEPYEGSSSHDHQLNYLTVQPTLQDVKKIVSLL